MMRAVETFYDDVFPSWRQPFYLVGVATVPNVYFTSQHPTMTLYDSRGTYHVI